VIAEECNCPSSDQSNLIIKDKVYSKCQNKCWYQFDKFGNWVSECGLEAIGKPVDPMEAILEEAICRYPVGTKIRPVHADGTLFHSECEVRRRPTIYGDAIEASVGYIYKDGTWAKILDKNQDIEEILAEAILRYPVGTKYRPISLNGSEWSKGSAEEVTYTPRICGNSIEGGLGFLYMNGKWARVVGDLYNPCSEIPLTTSSGTYTGFSGTSSTFSDAITGSTFAEINARYHTGIYYGGIDPVQLVPNKVNNVPHQEPKILRHKEKRRKLVIVNQ